MITDEVYKRIMSEWDYWRRQIAEGDRSSGPRDWFESILQEIEDIKDSKN